MIEIIFSIGDVLGLGTRRPEYTNTPDCPREVREKAYTKVLQERGAAAPEVMHDKFSHDREIQALIASASRR